MRVFGFDIKVSKAPKKVRRLGTNALIKKQQREQAIEEFFEKPLVLFVIGVFIAGGLWLAFSLAIVLDPSNPYNNF